MFSPIIHNLFIFNIRMIDPSVTIIYDEVVVGCSALWSCNLLLPTNTCWFCRNKRAKPCNSNLLMSRLHFSTKPALGYGVLKQVKSTVNNCKFWILQLSARYYLHPIRAWWAGMFMSYSCSEKHLNGWGTLSEFSDQWCPVRKSMGSFVDNVSSFTYWPFYWLTDGKRTFTLETFGCCLG